VESSFREQISKKIAGTAIGLWLLIPEHLRLGSWDLLKVWTGNKTDEDIEKKLGLQMIHEAAMCQTRIRQSNTICHQGFDILNGLPFIATDKEIHKVLSKRTIEESKELQKVLGMIRQDRGDYKGKVIALDPHRIVSYSERIMPKKKSKRTEPSKKVIQTFFAIDAETGQPIGFEIGFSSETVSKATINLMDIIREVIPYNPLIISDCEHYTEAITSFMKRDDRFDIMIPAPSNTKIKKIAMGLDYKPYWAGYYIAETEFKIGKEQKENLRLIVQREGEKESDYKYKGFVTTGHQFSLEILTKQFPKRWTIEEFFNFEGAIGWDKANSLNLNIRYGKMTLAMITQSLIYKLKEKLPKPYREWETKHFSEMLFKTFNGDIRVKDEKIIVTLYGIPENLGLKNHYENLPEKLEKENINPKVPWLYDFKVDFRFK